MTLIRSLWRRFTSTRRSRALESAARTERALNEDVARQGAEIERLRAENRALLNSILGIAGIPPISIGLPGRRFVEPGSSDTTFTAPQPAVGHSGSSTTSAGGEESLRPSHLLQTAPMSDSSSHSRSAGDGTRNDSSPLSKAERRAAAIPLRRRSWHQINRMLEVESGKKAVTSDS
jgi:hypothetical protein